MADYLMTIDSDGEDDPPKVSNRTGAEDAVLNPDFVFDLSGDPFADVLDQHNDAQDLVHKGTKPVRYIFYST